MPDETNLTDPAQDDGALSTGELLRHAREEKGFTIQQVAQALHLDAWILEALESNRFKDIGAPVFVKGHLRKFAAEVGLSSDAVMDAYYRSEDTPDMPRLVTDTLTRPAGDSRSRGPILALSVVLILLIGLVAWLWLRGQGFTVPGGSADSAASEVESGISARLPAIQIESPDSGEIADLEQDAAASPENTMDAGIDGEAEFRPDTEPAEQPIEVAAGEAEQPRQDAVAAQSQPPPGEGLRRLSITFANDSWVEIYDRGNRRLFFDLGRSGTRRTVEGEPPLQVLLGNAEDARITVDDEPFTIPAGSRRGKTARFAVP